MIRYHSHWMIYYMIALGKEGSTGIEVVGLLRSERFFIETINCFEERMVIHGNNEMRGIISSSE